MYITHIITTKIKSYQYNIYLLIYKYTFLFKIIFETLLHPKLILQSTCLALFSKQEQEMKKIFTIKNILFYMKKINIFGIVLIICIIVILGLYALTNSDLIDHDAKIVDVNALDKKGVIKLDNQSKDLNGGIFTSNKSDENSIFLNKSSILKLTKSFINKTGDTATSGDAADFYGVNSAILVKDKSQLTVEDCEIVTNSKGSNGIFVTNTDTGQGQGGAPGGTPPGEGGTPPGNGGEAPEKPPEQMKTSKSTDETVAKINSVKITTHQDKSRGLDATFGGIIEADNVEINTDGNSCAGLATDRGEGNVTVENSVINTGVSKETGRGSPIIYSTGNITLQNSKGTSYVSQIACIEGKNSITLEDSELTGFGEGNRKDGDEYVDLAGIFIYQSMSGDANVGTSTFNCKNTDLKIDESSSYYKQIPMFHVTNTKANINLDSSTFNFGSGILFDISSQNQWGNNGSNGGDVNLTSSNEDLKGDIIVDSISSLNFTLKSKTFEGGINSTGNTSVIIDKGATWSLTGDSNITSLKNSGTINLNGHKLLVNGEEYKG